MQAQVLAVISLALRLGSALSCDVATGAIEVACSSLEIISGVENILPTYREDPIAGTQCEIKTNSRLAYAQFKFRSSDSV